MYIVTDQEIDQDLKSAKMMRLELFEKSYIFRDYHIHQLGENSRTSRILRKSDKISLFIKFQNNLRF